MACGHGVMMQQWHERFGATGVGVEASPYTAARARTLAADRAPRAIEIVEGRGEDFATDERFDVACCLGAAWIWGGYRGALEALSRFCKPGGAVVSGEPYWRSDPPAEYLEAVGFPRDTYNDLDGCRRVARDLGLELIWMAASSEAEWDGYEMRQNASLDAFAKDNPDDPDLPGFRATRRRHDASYFRWGRASLGWALWAFRLPG